MGSARLVISVLATGCYSPVVHEGVPCSPATDNCPTGQHCIDRGGGYACWSSAGPDAATDSPADSVAIDAAPRAVCAADPSLGLCFDFDASPLGTLFDPMYFTGGYAVHGNPIVPPYPASHGCVRVPMWIAPYLFQTNRYGETVYVYS